MWGGLHPALFLFRRFILEPCSAAFAALGAWAALRQHEVSASFLLAGFLITVLMAWRVSRSAGAAPGEPPRTADAEEGDEERVGDDWDQLSHAIVALDTLLCVLLMGLVWSEHFSLIRSAVFVVLFSIVFPAATALFCLGGERILRERSAHRAWPPWGGAVRRH